MEAHRSAARSAKSNGRAAPIPLVYGEMAKYFRDGRDEPVSPHPPGSSPSGTRTASPRAGAARTVSPRSARRPQHGRLDTWAAAPARDCLIDEWTKQSPGQRASAVGASSGDGGGGGERRGARPVTAPAPSGWAAADALAQESRLRYRKDEVAAPREYVTRRPGTALTEWEVPRDVLTPLAAGYYEQARQRQAERLRSVRTRHRHIQ